MKDSELARGLVRKIVRAAKRAEALAKGKKDFSAQANEVLECIEQLVAIPLLPKRRREFATSLEAQGERMGHYRGAMVLGGYLCNAAKALRTNSTPANTSPHPAPAPMPA